MDPRESILRRKLEILEQHQNMKEQELQQIMRQIFKEKLKELENNGAIQQLNELENIVKFQLKNIQSNKRNYLTLVNLVFLPLGFIAGFFGMNFRSMGTPSLSKGILTIPHGEKFVFGLSLLSSISIIMYYYALVV